MFKKFSDWMNFNPPAALSWDGWQDFKTEFRDKAPIRYFLTKVLAQQIRYYYGYVGRAIWWLRYRTIDRYHVVRTGLNPGWHDVSEQILYTNFTMLVDFVEIEKAWMHIVFDEKKFKETLGWRTLLPRILRKRCLNFRSREFGIANLDWEISLGSESPHQSEAAKVIKDLYLWWVDIRPQREEIPHPTRSENEAGTGTIFSERWSAENPDKSNQIREWARLSREQEEAWDQEDTAKLVELVKVRQSLWT